MGNRNRNYALLALASLVGVSVIGPAVANEDPIEFGGFVMRKGGTAEQRRTYESTIRKTAAMVGDSTAQRLVDRYKLDLLNLTWEDTGRFKGSSVGPNISDMTIQVAIDRGRGRVEPVLMPVIRHPNYSDITGEIDPRDLTLLVGNEKGRNLRRVSLHDFLASPSRYLSDPDSWTSRRRTLLAPRDEKVLVSAQACFLPVPLSGKATFNPVLFNYQSSPKNPAVLTILATREGTSTTIIDNARDGFGSWNWGQRLFHNANGMRASLTGERLSDWNDRGRPGEGQGNAKVGDDALNMVLMIQVPLKHREPRREAYGGAGGGADYKSAAPMTESAAKSKDSDVENAVIGHGDEEGPFTEMDNLAVERDERFPVRVTVQFYKATSNGVVNEKDIREISEDIDSVYKASTSVGSLVTSGATGRITEYDGPKVQNRDWWQNFWRNYQSWSGLTPEQGRARLIKLIGKDYEDRPVTDLYLRDHLRK